MSESEPKIVELVIEGHDGAAKTPIVNGVFQRLSEEGHKVKACAPFSEANSALGRDIYEFWISGSKEKIIEGLKILRGIVQKTRDDFAKTLNNEEVGVLIFDRGWMTLLRALDEVPEGLISDDDSTLNDEVKFWTDNIPPTVFGVTTPEITRDCEKFSRDIPWTATDNLLNEDYDRRLELASLHQDNIVHQYQRTDKRQNLTPIIEDIVQIIKRLIEKS
jgi:hypothetical protein